jgi:hypothetical protein
MSHRLYCDGCNRKADDDQVMKVAVTLHVHRKDDCIDGLVDHFRKQVIAETERAIADFRAAQEG